MEITANVPVELLTLVLLPRKSAEHLKWSLELAHELLKTEFSQTQASSLHTTTTRNPHGSGCDGGGMGGKQYNLPSSCLLALVLSGQHRGLPPGEDRPPNSVMVLQVQ